MGGYLVIRLKGYTSHYLICLRAEALAKSRVGRWRNIWK